ncbi:queuosine precursor transporter [Pelagibacteraceae bacterium]|nr:queuosine precursor transporter [Pelagibacteraceae bacterium]|tara:strand:+ start:2285 stop:3025 length:741 start_codon:yes stop_codon:yes gene_type:complete
MNFFFNLTAIFNSFSTELMWVILLFFCYISILTFLRLFGYVGIFIYCALAVIGANIQVLKTVDFFYSPEPVALGTILFASTFLCTDILSEYFDKNKARMNILIGFCAFLFMTLLMVITIGFKPSSDDWVQESLSNVFTPMTRFFIASMIAYLISQYFDVWFFNYIKRVTSEKYLWLRNNLSTIASSLVDNTVFSIFAWILLNPEPVSIYNVIMIYILGTYLLRILLALFDTPLIYLAKFFIKKTNV